MARCVEDRFTALMSRKSVHRGTNGWNRCFLPNNERVGAVVNVHGIHYSIVSKRDSTVNSHVHVLTTSKQGRKGQDHHPSTRRLSLEELKAKGIYRTPEEVQAEEEEHDQTRTFLQKELDQRCTNE